LRLSLTFSGAFPCRLLFYQSPESAQVFRELGIFPATHLQQPRIAFQRSEILVDDPEKCPWYRLKPPFWIAGSIPVSAVNEKTVFIVKGVTSS